MKVVQWTVDFDYGGFESALFEAARAAFTDLRLGFKDESIYAYALMTNLDFDSVGIAANSEERLTETAINVREEYARRNNISLADARILHRYRHHDFGIDNRQPGDGTFAYCNNMLSEYSNQIRALIEYNQAIIVPHAVNDIVKYLHERLEFVFLKVMCALDDSGVFETPLPEYNLVRRIIRLINAQPVEDRRSTFTLFVTRTDISDAIDDFSVLLVNPPEVARRFKAELDMAEAIERRLQGDGNNV